MASGSTPGHIRQGLSGGLASGELLGTGSCWLKEGELQRKAHGEPLQTGMEGLSRRRQWAGATRAKDGLLHHKREVLGRSWSLGHS